MRNRIAIAAAILLITVLGYLLFPGHTWLQEDTQIYVPILEHRWDPAVLANDPVATETHVGYTIYDEIVLGVKSLTGAGFHTIMAADQIVFRAAAICGVFLIALSLGLPARLALLVAGIYALGATVMGPSVLTVEYEPKPRGSAVGLILLAVGLLGQAKRGKRFRRPADPPAATSPPAPWPRWPPSIIHRPRTRSGSSWAPGHFGPPAPNAVPGSSPLYRWPSPPPRSS